MSQFSFFVPDAQSDPFREYFRFYSLSSLSEDSLFLSCYPLDLQDSQTSQPSTYAPATSTDERIAIQTALKFKIPRERIRKVLRVTESQIEYARSHRGTSQISKAGCKPQLRASQRSNLEQGLLESFSHRQIQFRYIPSYTPEFERITEQEIKTAIISWVIDGEPSRRRVYQKNQMFANGVWSLRAKLC